MNKKSTIIVGIIAVAFYSCQTGKVLSVLNMKESGELAEAVKTIETYVDPSNEKSEKTIEWPKTWEVRGEIYQAIYKSEDSEIKNLYPSPLAVALNSYKKALQLDLKNKYENSLKIKLTLLTNDLSSQAIEAFNENNYNKALESFEQILEIQDINIMKEEGSTQIDTVILYNAGLAAYNSENYNKAIEYYKEVAKLGYNGANTYGLLGNTYLLKKDTLGALNILKEGFEKYPDDNTVLNSLIQIYLDQNKTNDAMKYLEMAIAQDPGNATYYFAQGTLFEKLGDEANAIERYKKAIELDPEFFNAYYNLGALYYNKGIKQIEVALAVPQGDNKKYEEETAKADQWWNAALPYMEKCQELKADDPLTLESLKNLYYRMKDMEKYNAILEQLGQ